MRKVEELRARYKGKDISPIGRAISFLDSEGFGDEAEEAAAELERLQRAAREFMRVNELHDHVTDSEWIAAYNELNDAMKG